MLFVVPEARLESVWRELLKRLGDADIATLPHPLTERTLRAARTGRGPELAITSWKRLLATIEAELDDDPETTSDLLQLRALCGAADVNAFSPLTPEELTDHRTPALVLQMHDIVEGVVNVAVEKGTLDITKLLPQLSKERIGRYALIPTNTDAGFGVWIGLHFRLWKEHGCSPLWLLFNCTKWGRGLKAQPALEPWCDRMRLPFADEDEHFACALDLPTGAEKEEVIEYVANRLSRIRKVLIEAEAGNG